MLIFVSYFRYPAQPYPTLLVVIGVYAQYASSHGLHHMSLAHHLSPHHGAAAGYSEQSSGQYGNSGSNGAGGDAGERWRSRLGG